MTLLWLCGAWRVAVCAAYLAVVITNPDLGDRLQVAAAALALIVVIYDLLERRRRA